MDLLGFGEAPKPNHVEYGYDDQIRHITATLDLLGINTPVCLVGHSMGALIAARYGMVHPGKVSSTVLLHPPLYKNRTEAHVTLRRTNMLYRFLLDSRYRHIVWMFIRIVGFRLIGNHSPTAREKSLQNIIESPRIFDDLKEITTKTLVVVGRKDRPVYRDNVTNLATSDAVSVTQEDISHHSPILRPTLIHNRIAEFI